MSKTIGIFGSAFNPPSKGHANAITQGAKEFDEVWLVPSYSHPHGKKPLDFNERLHLLSLFKKELKLTNVKISNIEKECFELLNKEYVYTYDLLIFLKNKYPQNKFVFICGQDNAEKEAWSKFYKNNEIDEEFGKFVVEDVVDIRSTYIRDAIKSKNINKLKDLTYPSITEYLMLNKKYI